MANVLALAGGGLLPLGLGRFAGSTIDGPASFYFVNAWRADRLELAAQARAKGAEVWLWGGPEHWEPTKWREAVDFIGATARAMGAVGVCADPENVWPSLDRATRRAELRALGAALRGLASDMRVGVSTYPDLPDMDALAEGCGEDVFMLVQVYGIGAFDARSFARWVGRARSYFGASRTGIAIAGWPAREAMSTPAGFTQYLAMLPDSPCNVSFNLGAMPAYIATALASRHAGGNVLGDAAWGSLALVGRPAGAVVLVSIVVVLAVLVLAWRAR